MNLSNNSIFILYTVQSILDTYNYICFISREDVKDESPKVGEASFLPVDSFPLKKDDKSLKTMKLIAEDKKSIQKPLESALSKKSVEVAKKNKREKRDCSTDSEDSDAEGKEVYTSVDR